MTTFRFRASRSRVWVNIGLSLALCGCGARSGLRDSEDYALDRLPECAVEGATRACETICGEGLQLCRDGEWQPCNAERPMAPVLEATIRDFSDSHPDFEGVFPDAASLGIIQRQLGSDDKPVYANAARNRSTTSEQAFDQWYRDTPGVNLTFGADLALVASGNDSATFVYKSSSFFPIDGLGWGNEGRNHNYHFTLEVATAFRYVGGEVFKFTGDDDLWVFINRQLVIDLGGTHSSLSAQVELDGVADELGLERDNVYELHLFFAERHTIASNFNIETTIAEFEFCN